MFSQGFADYLIVIAYLDPQINIELGSHIEFDAVYNTNLSMYVVRRYCCAKMSLKVGYRLSEAGSDRFVSSRIFRICSFVLHISQFNPVSTFYFKMTYYTNIKKMKDGFYAGK